MRLVFQQRISLIQKVFVWMHFNWRMVGYANYKDLNHVERWLSVGLVKCQKVTRCLLHHHHQVVLTTMWSCSVFVCWSTVSHGQPNAAQVIESDTILHLNFGFVHQSSKSRFHEIGHLRGNRQQSTDHQPVLRKNRICQNWIELCQEFSRFERIRRIWF